MNVGRNKERGATLIEAAIIVPLLLLVSSASSSMGSPSRTNSLSPTSPEKEPGSAPSPPRPHCGLCGLGELVSANDLARIDRVEIYEANQNTGDLRMEPPAT